MTKLARCGAYRVFVVYANGTDMLFLDKLSPTADGVALAPTRGMPFAEFNVYEASNLIDTIHCEVVGPQTVHISGQAVGLHADQKFRFAIKVDTATQCYTYQDNRP